MASSAQSPDGPVRIGVLTNSWGPPAVLESTVGELAELDLTEHRDFVIAVWFTQGKPEELPPTVDRMINAGVDIIVTVGPMEVAAAAEATRSIPIVFVDVNDPVSQGLVDSFARPGGNLTGIADAGFGVGSRRLQLFKEMVPSLELLLLPFNQDNQYQAAEVEEYAALASRLDITVVRMPFGGELEADAIAAVVGEWKIDGIISPRDVDLNIPGQILSASRETGVPAMFDLPQYVEAGGLASFGGSIDAIGKQVARFIAMIIGGQEPGTIPVETPGRLELVINIGTANQLGLTVPPMLLFQAGRVVR